MEKVLKSGANVDTHKEDIDFYVTKVSPSKIRPASSIHVRPTSASEVKGWVEEQEEKQRKWAKR